MFTIGIMVKLVIKPRVFRTVARQPALTWQAVCIEIVVRGLKCYHPSTKTIRSSSTELWHILAEYIMCSCDLDLWPRVGHGSIFADPIQSNPSTHGSNPIQSKNSWY